MTYPKFIRDRMLEMAEEIGDIEEVKIWKELSKIDAEMIDNEFIKKEIEPILTAILPKKRGRPKKGETDAPKDT